MIRTGVRVGESGPVVAGEETIGVTPGIQENVYVISLYHRI